MPALVWLRRTEANECPGSLPVWACETLARACATECEAVIRGVPTFGRATCWGAATRRGVELWRGDAIWRGAE
jgi:hypothetical protein